MDAVRNTLMRCLLALILLATPLTAVSQSTIDAVLDPVEGRWKATNWNGIQKSTGNVEFIQQHLDNKSYRKKYVKPAKVVQFPGKKPWYTGAIAMCSAYPLCRAAVTGLTVGSSVIPMVWPSGSPAPILNPNGGLTTGLPAIAPEVATDPDAVIMSSTIDHWTACTGSGTFPTLGASIAHCFGAIDTFTTGNGQGTCPKTVYYPGQTCASCGSATGRTIDHVGYTVGWGAVGNNCAGAYGAYARCSAGTAKWDAATKTFYCGDILPEVVPPPEPDKPVRYRTSTELLQEILEAIRTGNQKRLNELVENNPSFRISDDDVQIILREIDNSKHVNNETFRRYIDNDFRRYINGDTHHMNWSEIVNTTTINNDNRIVPGDKSPTEDPKAENAPAETPFPELKPVEPPTREISFKNVYAAINPIAFNVSKACPSPVRLSVRGHSGEISFQPVCDLLRRFRGVFIAIAWFIAFLIMIRGLT